MPPSFDEMKDVLDLRSKSGIHRLITALEERGFIRRLPNRARAIEVIRLPESVARHGGAVARLPPNVIEGNLGRVRAASEDDGGRPVAMPVMGRIAAGMPIEAIQTAATPSACRPSMLSPATLRARSARQFHDRGRHPRRQHCVSDAGETADTGDIVVR